jgi:hypothetical protein
MVTHLEPLTIASNLTQAENTCLDHVLLTLSNLFRIYDDTGDADHDIKNGIQASLEKRWAKADQDPFILTIFFNPYIHADLFNRKIIQFMPASMYGIVKCVYKCIFRTEPDFDLHAACLDYYKCREEFSDDAVHDELEGTANAKVGSFI